MYTRENLSQSQTTVTDLFHDLSRIMIDVEQRLRGHSFTAVGDSAVFQDVSAAFDRSSRWFPKYLARAYVNSKTPNRTIGYCIHLGPYSDPTTAAYLDKSRLELPFISLACLKDMRPGPLEVDRRQIWDRLWDSGWWATYEDQVTGPLRTYSTTKEISGFQAIITGALVDFFPFNAPGDVVERIVTPLILLFETRTDELLHSPHLLTRP